MKYLTTRFCSFTPIKISKRLVTSVVLTLLLISTTQSISAQITNPASSSTATSPSVSNVILSTPDTSNSFTVTFNKLDFYHLICISLILSTLLFLFIRRTLLSKQKIETANFKLMRKHSKFKSLFHDTSDAMILIKEMRYFDVNLATLSLFGYTDKKKLINIKIGSFSPKIQPDGIPSQDKINYHFGRCEKQGSSRFEWQCQKPDGNILWLDITITKIVINKEALIHMICRDIDEMKKLEYQNTIKNMQLENSNRELVATIDNLNQVQDKLVATEKMAALGALVAGISHEINTPVGMSLTGISHFKSLTEEIVNDFKNQKLTQSKLQKYLENSEQACRLTTVNLEKAATLISSFKQIAVDQTSEEKRVFNVKHYIDEILASIHSVIKKSQLDVFIHCPEDAVIDSYPGALSQILTNLIMNSVIHGFKNRIDGKIHIHVTFSEDSLYIKYSDNGVGIKAQNLPKIFDPFFTTNRNNGGSGLGLNIIYNLVCNTFKGEINCDSTINEGTTFSIKLCAAITRPTSA